MNVPSTAIIRRQDILGSVLQAGPATAPIWQTSNSVYERRVCSESARVVDEVQIRRKCKFDKNKVRLGLVSKSACLYRSLDLITVYQILNQTPS